MNSENNKQVNSNQINNTNENNDSLNNEISDKKNKTSNKDNKFKQNKKNPFLNFWKQYFYYLKKGSLHPANLVSETNKNLKKTIIYFGILNIFFISIFNAISVTILFNKINNQIGYMQLINPQLNVGFNSSIIGLFFQILIIEFIFFFIYSFIAWIFQRLFQISKFKYFDCIGYLMQKNSILVFISIFSLLISIISLSLSSSVLFIVFIFEYFITIINLGIYLYEGHCDSNHNLDVTYTIILSLILLFIISFLLFRISIFPIFMKMLEILSGS